MYDRQSPSRPNRFALRIPSILLVAFACFASTIATAQQVYWSPSSGTLQQGKANRIQLHFEGCSPDGSISLPDIAEAEFTHVGQSSSMNMFKRGSNWAHPVS